jgi:eukaryotic-like serine/threonine-protein kinase
MTSGTASQNQAGESSVAPVRPGEVVADKYVVERTLGVGGMGVVVAARDQVLDRPVAIKFLLPKLAGSETSVQRFVREARAATRVTSEHVVRLLEIDKLPSGTPFFVMEYLHGSDLRAYLRENGPLEPSQAVDYALQALQAVAEGHIKGIVHRDIKPGNLFLTMRADGTPLIKVLDFGIAKTIEGDAAESTSLTSSDDVRLGSPAYMPPEQLQNPRDVDTRSDIWSLGATLYELVSGRPPFAGSAYLELASRILSSSPPAISQQDMQYELPLGLEQVLRRCLEKERSLRYANAAELAAALAPFGSDDARVSLARVAGIWGSSHPSSGSLALHDSGSCTTTLTVAAAPTASRSADKHDTSNIGPVAAPPRRRSWVVLVGAAALVLAIMALSHSTADPHKSAATALAIEVMPAPAVVDAPTAHDSPPPAFAPSGPLPTSAKRAAASAAPVASPQRPMSGAERAPVKSPAAPVPMPSALLPETQASQAPPSSSARPGSGLGRSVEIERLIEQRR